MQLLFGPQMLPSEVTDHYNPLKLGWAKTEPPEFSSGTNKID